MPMTIKDAFVYLEDQINMTEGKKKKKKPYNSVTYTTGDPQLNIDHFNKMLSGKEQNTHTDGYLNGTFKGPEAASPDGASCVSDIGGGASSSGDGGGVSESIDLVEKKRYVRRYFMKPQNIWLSNKDEVLKALTDHEDQDCIVYTLINQGNTKDEHKLTSNDIIYYYEDGILYDKNHVRIMDYKLSIKNEEEREHIDPQQTSDAKFAKVYADRMTDASDVSEAFKLDFNDVIVESIENKCCICGEEIIGYGNNAEPYKDGRCCEACNAKFVIPARIEAMKEENK